MHWVAIRVSSFCRHCLQTISLTLAPLHRVLEMQIIIISLVENFELSLPPQTEKTRIYRKPIALMLPMAEGRRGSWMGLAVKSLEA